MKAFIMDYLQKVLVLGRIDEIDNYLHPNFMAKNPFWDERISRENHIKLTKLLLMAFDNIHLEWKYWVIEKEKGRLFVNYIFKGIHVRDIYQFKARRNAIQVDIGAYYIMQKDKIVFEKTFFDVNAIIQQIQRI